MASSNCDAVIIGAGADGLAAAAVLARAGLSTFVFERNAEAGGRCQTREFHPGFRASPFADELAPIPPQIFWSFALARRGVVFVPSAASLALWPDRRSVLLPRSPNGLHGLFAEARSRTAAIVACAKAQSAPVWRWQRVSGAGLVPWPAEDWAQQSLCDVIERAAPDEHDAAHAVASSLCGRAADPFLAGSALHLVAPGAGGSGLVPGGGATLGRALFDVAREAGAVVSRGIEATDIRHAGGRVTGVGLSDGTDIDARAILSTLDFKRTFLSLFDWAKLPRPLMTRVGAYRTQGATARLLIALERVPDCLATNGMSALARGPIYLAPDVRAMAQAHATWRGGALPEHPPITLRLPSLVDPSLAPPGRATLTATIGCVPYRLFDGAWTREKRDVLQRLVISAIEALLPGTADRVLAAQLIVPPDIEDALALTDGDLCGGEIAADNMLGARPWGARRSGSRAPFRGLYLAGPSTAAGVVSTCASGVLAAEAMLGDLKRGWLS